jgi:hypothetical protein
MDILHPVKAEPVDVPLYSQGVADVEDTGSRKKRKLIVMVVVPTLKEVDRMRKAELGYKEETKVFQVRLRRFIQQFKQIDECHAAHKYQKDRIDENQEKPNGI